MASIFKTNPWAAIMFVIMLLAAFAFVFFSAFSDGPPFEMETPTTNEQGIEQVTPE